MENNDWKNQLVSLILLEFLRIKGFVKVEKYAFEILKDTMMRFLEKIMIESKNYSESDMRNEVSFQDVLKVAHINEIDIDDILNYLKSAQNKHRSSSELINSKFIRSHKRILQGGPL